MSVDISPAPGRYPFTLTPRWTAVAIEPLPGVIALGLFLDGEPVEVITESDDVKACARADQSGPGVNRLGHVAHYRRGPTPGTAARSPTRSTTTCATSGRCVFGGLKWNDEDADDADGQARAAPRRPRPHAQGGATRAAPHRQREAGRPRGRGRRLRSLCRGQPRAATEGVAPLFAEDLVAIAPGLAVKLKGREALVKSYVDYCREVRTHAFRELEHPVDVCGDVAVATYRYEVGGKTFDELGQEVLVFAKREVDGQPCGGRRSSLARRWRRRNTGVAGGQEARHPE